MKFLNEEERDFWKQVIISIINGPVCNGRQGRQDAIDWADLMTESLRERKE